MSDSINDGELDGKDSEGLLRELNNVKYTIYDKPGASEIEFDVILFVLAHVSLDIFARGEYDEYANSEFIIDVLNISNIDGSSSNTLWISGSHYYASSNISCDSCY